MEEVKNFRGDTIPREANGGDYTFQKGDVLKIALMSNICDEVHAFDKIIEVSQDQKTIRFEIPPEITRKLSPGRYLLEYELTTNLGLVSTTQEEISIKGDGIR